MAMMPRKESFQGSLIPPPSGASGWIPGEEADQLADLQNRIQTIARLLLEGSGIEPFLDAVETLLHNPVAIIRESGKTWQSLSLRAMDPSEAWTMAQALAFRHIGRISGSGFANAVGGSRVYVSAIPVRRSKQACLVLLERDKEITQLDTYSIERMAALAGMEMANMDAVKEVEGKYLDQFLQDWISGKIVSEADWRQRADVAGCSLPEETPLCAVLVAWPVPGPVPEMLREYARRIRSEKFRGAEELLASPIGKDLALVVPMPSEPSSDDAGASERLLERLLYELRPLVEGQDIRMFAGRAVPGPAGIHGSWMQAVRTRQISEICGMKDDLLTYEKLGVYSLLFMIPSGAEREQFLDRYFHPLRQADHKGGGRLSETLEMFFRCNGNIKLTSEKLSAHYNTVVYRLEKIQNILGVSLDDSEDRLQLQIAVKLGKIPMNANG
ncbi:CdaR family transcriptional regulator [Cohnella sp. CFH 77786]|uniref:PucR family transcriptional regulator n=1 Tax=Cohnella sp. CFH 77786 TaxID=2662265 RepID=UPI001C60999F|nr:helix-turn-helix domain-containing protein [Cohnella sp. CFH 77786]